MEYKIVHCSFCGQPNTKTLCLVTNKENTAAICVECIEIAQEIVVDAKNKAEVQK